MKTVLRSLLAMILVITLNSSSLGFQDNQTIKYSGKVVRYENSGIFHKPNCSLLKQSPFYHMLSYENLSAAMFLNFKPDKNCFSIREIPVDIFNVVIIRHGIIGSIQSFREEEEAITYRKVYLRKNFGSLEKYKENQKNKSFLDIKIIKGLLNN